MSSDRWWNLILWGLGNRLDKTNDYRSDLLMVVDLLIWIQLLAFLIIEGPVKFLVLWTIGFPLGGQFIDWIVIQLLIGYIIARGGWKRAQPPPPKLQQREGQPGVHQGPSEEP